MLCIPYQCSLLHNLCFCCTETEWDTKLLPVSCYSVSLQPTCNHLHWLVTEGYEHNFPTHRKMATLDFCDKSAGSLLWRDKELMSVNTHIWKNMCGHLQGTPKTVRVCEYQIVPPHWHQAVWPRSFPQAVHVCGIEWRFWTWAKNYLQYNHSLRHAWIRLTGASIINVILRSAAWMYWIKSLDQSIVYEAVNPTTTYNWRSCKLFIW